MIINITSYIVKGGDGSTGRNTLSSPAVGGNSGVASFTTNPNANNTRGSGSDFPGTANTVLMKWTRPL